MRRTTRSRICLSDLDLRLGAVWFIFSRGNTDKALQPVPFHSDGKGSLSNCSKLLVTLRLQGPKQKRDQANEKTKTHHRKEGEKEWHLSVHAMIDMSLGGANLTINNQSYLLT